ncbi:MAG TPA: hypothetical protein VIV66_15005 [Pyrinomonadaceae bacterium]
MRRPCVIFLFVTSLTLPGNGAIPHRNGLSEYQEPASSATQPTAADPLYLKLPSIPRVMQEIQGSDRIDTAARLSAALAHLERIVDLKRRSHVNVPEDSWRCLQVYNFAAYDINPSLGDTKAYTSEESLRWLNLYHVYEIDSAFIDDLLKRFFSTEFSSRYEKLDVKLRRSRVRCDLNCGPNKSVVDVFSGVTLDCAEVLKAADK